MQPAEIVALLKWYAEAGVDEAIGEEPGAFARPKATPGARAPAPASARSAGVPPAPLRTGTRAGETPALPVKTRSPAALPGTDAASSDARRIAAGCRTLAELRAAIDAFEGCALKAVATQMVFADGNPEAAVMIVGEAPGAEEDRQGRPFVGQSGQLLDRMLAAIGLDRSSVYITNIVNWRPPGNRLPSAGEIAVSMPFIERHIALKRPRLVLCAGGTAAAALLAAKEGITRIHGRWYDRVYDDMAAPVPTMPTYHPAFLLRQASMKRDVWRDLLTFKAKLRELGL
jgi:uracil-DNA glycosylase family 4